MEISAVNNLASSAKYFESIGAKSGTAVKLAFPDAALNRWVHGLDQITSAISEPWVALKFAISSVAVAQAHGVEMALTTVPTALAITKSAGSRATSVFFDTLPKLSDALKDHASVRTSGGDA